MEGITILNEVAVNAAPTWTIALILTPLVGMAAFWIVTLITESDFAGVATLCCLGLLAIGLITVAIVGTCAYDHTEYQVLIDENVSFTEFDEKYEIVEKNGEIYTIKEKED